jgi:microsomal dipeptidase-like Zn-dependent dipeptidase
VGGVNLAAVERMTRVSGGWGRIVWMPTFDAENEVRSKKEARPFVSVSKNGKLLPEVLRMLDLIAAKKLVLATGHSTAAEDLLLIREARKRGVEKIVVTHGMLAPVLMTAEQAREAGQLGAYVEFVGNAMIGQTKSVTFAGYVKAMRAIGVEHCILSSDLGQAGNPLHPDGLEQIFAGLRAAGMSIAEIETVAKRNPARLLGLDQ